MLTKRRPKAWLFFAVRRSLKHLSRDTRRKQASKRLSAVYLKLMMSWDLMADMEADLRVAKVLGGSTVATWICQTQLASQIAPTCLQGAIQPGAERGVLLPIAFSCAAFYGLIEPGWMATVENARVKAQRSQPGNPLLKLLVLRLAALPHGSGSVQDPDRRLPC
jgi:hypothetical protein